MNGATYAERCLEAARARLAEAVKAEGVACETERYELRRFLEATDADHAQAASDARALARLARGAVVAARDERGRAESLVALWESAVEGIGVKA